MLRNLGFTRSLAPSLILAGALALAGCGDPVAARAQGGVAPDAVGVQTSVLGLEQHAVVSSDGRDPYASARDVGTGEITRDIGTGELMFVTAGVPLDGTQHGVVSSDGHDPYASARDIGTGEFILDIATGEPLR
jgi:hypothetical protein